ncbi:MAG TPA: peroxiredoxin [Microthrixaceae bacterium]|nr:peroxiredoxin [Microthrixaceae bacterium]
MINKGDEAPEFALPDQSGTTVSLSELLQNGPVVLFFYPKAMTSGCTKESCHFRDLAAEFAAVGAQRVGISADGVDRQAQFAAKHDFDYPLLSDKDREVAAAFGVKRPGPLFNRRATFVIGTDRKILASLASEMNMDMHADKALEILAENNKGT